MRPVLSTRPGRTSVVALAAAVSLLALAMLSPAASAHGDEGEMELTRLEQVGADRAKVEVGIVYANDGHLAEDATVSAELTHDDGTLVGPVDLLGQGEGTSLYGATVDLPAAGTWSVAVTSIGPDASVEGTLVVVDAPPTTEAPTTEAPTTAAPTTEPPATTDADDTSGVSPPTDDLAAAVDDGDGTTLLIVVLIALAVIALAGGGVWWSRRDRPGDTTPTADER